MSSLNHRVTLKRPTVYVSWSLSSGGETSREVAKRPDIETSKDAKRPGSESTKVVAKRPGGELAK